MQTVLYLFFIVVGYLITYFAHIQTKKEMQRQIDEKVRRMLLECEELKSNCKKVDAMINKYYKEYA